MSDLKQRIKRLEDMIQTERESKEYALDVLQSELESLKDLLEQSPPEPEKVLWEPRSGELLYIPHFGNKNHSLGACVGSAYHEIVMSRGLIFRTEAQAAKVGKYLAVIGKLCNLAMTLNEGRDGPYEYSVGNVTDGLAVVNALACYIDLPRLHSREAAERALAALSSEERAILIEGIS